MPASLYRLANKSHHAENVEIVKQAAPEIEDVQVVDSADTVPEGTLQVQTSQDSQLDADANANVEPVTPNWDPNWTKTKLLDFALSLGLNVTSTNTKTEIVNALTAVTSK